MIFLTSFFFPEHVSLIIWPVILVTVFYIFYKTYFLGLTMKNLPMSHAIDSQVSMLICSLFHAVSTLQYSI